MNKESDMAQISILKVEPASGFDKVYSVWENQGFKNGQLLGWRYLIDVHKDTDRWVRVIDTKYVSVMDSTIPLELSEIGFIEIQNHIFDGIIYKYIRLPEGDL